MIKDICVVGAGKIFQLYHLPAIEAVSSINVKYVVDKNFSLAQRVAKDIGAIPLETLDEKIDCKNFFITAPPQYRVEIFNLIKGYAKNIIFEKPVTLTLPEAEYIYKKAQENNINVMVAQTRRFFPNLNFIKNLINSNNSEHVNIEVYEGALFNWGTESNYFANKNPDDYGVFHDVGSHIFDFIIFFLEGILGEKGNGLQLFVEKSYLDKDQNANNSLSHFSFKNDTIEFNIKVRLSRTMSLSNQIIITNENTKLITRSLMSKDLKLMINDLPLLVNVPDFNTSYNLDDVFIDMWSYIYTHIQSNDELLNPSKIGLKSILKTVKLMQSLIEEKEIQNKLEEIHYE